MFKPCSQNLVIPPPESTLNTWQSERVILNPDEGRRDHCSWDHHPFHSHLTSNQTSLETSKPLRDIHAAPSSPTDVCSSTRGQGVDPTEKRDGTQISWFGWEAAKRAASSIFRDEELVASLLQNSQCQKQQASFQTKPHFNDQNQGNFPFGLSSRQSSLQSENNLIQHQSNMNYMNFSNPGAPQPGSIDFNGPLPAFESQPQQNVQQQLQVHHYHHAYDHTDQSVLMMSNLSPTSLDSGYGEQGSVTMSDHGESPPSSIMTNFQSSAVWPEYQGLNNNNNNNNNNHMFSFVTPSTKTCMTSGTQDQHSNTFCNNHHPYLSGQSFDHSSNFNHESNHHVDFYMSADKINSVNLDCAFGDCSQEEISELVDQVLNSLDIIPTSNSNTTFVDPTTTNGSLCQDCGHFNPVDWDTTLEEIDCRHCGAKIRCDNRLAEDSSEVTNPESTSETVEASIRSHSDCLHVQNQRLNKDFDRKSSSTEYPEASSHTVGCQDFDGKMLVKARHDIQNEDGKFDMKKNEVQKLNSEIQQPNSSQQMPFRRQGFADAASEKKIVGIVEPRIIRSKTKDSCLKSNLRAETTQLVSELPHTFKQALIDKGATVLADKCSHVERMSPHGKQYPDTSTEIESVHLKTCKMGSFSTAPQHHLKDRISISTKGPEKPVVFPDNDVNDDGRGHSPLQHQRNLIRFTKHQATTGLEGSCQCINSNSNSSCSQKKIRCKVRPTKTGSKTKQENIWPKDPDFISQPNPKRLKLDRPDSNDDKINTVCDCQPSIDIPIRKQIFPSEKFVSESKFKIGDHQLFEDKKTSEDSGRDKLQASNTTQNEFQFKNNRNSGTTRLKGETEPSNRILNSSASDSNCLEVSGKKNNEKTFQQSYSKLNDANIKEDDYEDEDEEDSFQPELKVTNDIRSKCGVVFSGPRNDDKWIYCKERGCVFWTRKPERMIRHAGCHVPDGKHYQCPDCTQRFYSLAKMLKHDRMVHTGVKDYECRVCDAEVTDIQIHMRVHKAEKQFECPACPLQFRHKNSLVRHLCQHTGERPYSCLQCDSAFISMHRLKEHTRKCHSAGSKVSKSTENPADMSDDDSDDTDSSSDKGIIFIGKKTPVSRPASIQTPKIASKVKGQGKGADIIVTSTPQVVPTVMTSLPTCVPLLVQDVNGQVFLLSTPNVQTSAISGGLFLPNTSSLELISPNQTIILRQ